MSLAEHIAEFREIVDAIYGTYLDACEGFSHVRSKVIEMEEESLRLYEEIKATRPEYAHLPFGGAEFSHGRHVPAGSPPRYRHLHQVDINTLKQRNETGGTNYRFIGNVCMVTLFQIWDERYRELFALDLAADKRQIEVALFGDLRHYRHAIIHNNGVATSDVEECLVLRWFKRGETILLTRDMFEEVIDAVFEFLVTLEADPEQYIRRA